MKEEDITWEMVITECRKRPDDPIAIMFLEVEAELIYLRKTLREICREN